MEWIKLLLFVECCFVFRYVGCAKYKILFEDTDIFETCSGSESDGISKFVDLTHLNRTILSDGSIHIGGYLKFMQDESLSDPITISVEVFKMSRGQYTSTVFNYYRPKFCQSFSDGSEFWHSSLKNITYKGPLCPFKKGTMLKFDSYLDVSLDLNETRHEGQYRCDVTLKNNADPPTASCVRARIDVALAD